VHSRVPEIEDGLLGGFLMNGSNLVAAYLLHLIAPRLGSKFGPVYAIRTARARIRN
jgi:hypothetical protein